MMRKIVLVWFVLLTTGLLQAQTPKRIISLAPSATKSLYALGADDLLVGCTSFCMLEHPGDAQVVASAIDVNIEKALLLKPDLVLTTSLTNPETIRTFEKLGVEVLNFPYPKSFDEICRYIKILGEKIGKKDVADKLVADALEKLEAVKAKVPANTEKPTIFIQIGANPLFAAVPNTFMQDFIEFSGCENIAGDLKIGSITRESVLVRNPDAIIVVLMGSLGADEKSKWEQYKNLNAVKNEKIFLMDQEKTCSPTPQLFVEALDEMIGYIYSE